MLTSLLTNKKPVLKIVQNPDILQRVLSVVDKPAQVVKLLGLFVSYTHLADWEHMVTENIADLLQLCTYFWQPVFYKEILWLMSNLPTSPHDQSILESDFYHLMIHTTFKNHSDIRELIYALINLLTPHMESPYVLGYF